MGDSSDALMSVAPVLLTLLGLFTAHAALDPVILLPAFAGSVLDANLTNRSAFRDCATTSADYCLYASAQQFTVRLDCMLNNMALHWDSQAGTSGCVANSAGVQTKPRDFGGLGGVTMVNPDDPSVAHINTLYDLINALESTLGYKKGTTLRGAPYDFRLVGDECYTETYLGLLKQLVEETVEQNGERVRFVCHSQGCLLGNVFLSRMESSWKDQHMSGLVALAPPFAGAPDVMQSLIVGPVETGITPVVLSTKLGKATGTWPGLVALMPANLGNITVYNSTPLVMTPSKNYTLSDMRDLLIDITDLNTTKSSYSVNRTLLWPYLSEHVWASSDPPGVNVDAFYVDDVATPYSIRFTKDDFSDGGQAVGHVAGDGTVPMMSGATPCQAWKERDTAHDINCVALQLGGTVHMGVPSDVRVIEKVVAILNSTTY